METFKALMASQDGGRVVSQIRNFPKNALPPGDVTITVEYSSLNYKDGLAVTGAGKIIRQLPMIPGIDLAGVVEHSVCDAWKPGDRVVLTGWGVGERYSGGYAQRTRVKSEWLVRLPDGLTTKQAMGIGTAGFTAMLCVMALEHEGAKPGLGDVVVTGAAGGVGSVAVAILSKLGFRVIASTGRAETHDYLRSLGAAEIIDRTMLSELSKKPLEAERWSAAVDSVGGTTLASLLKAMQYGASVAACGLAGGPDFASTVFPFILRGVNLLGIDSVLCPEPKRLEAWKRLESDLPMTLLEHMTQVISLGDVQRYCKEILAGKVRGRIVVDVNA